MAAGIGAPSFARNLGSLKGSFFDRDAVLKALGRTTRKHLNWFGGYVRKTARNSLKAKPGVSSPGRPPHVHTTYKRKHKSGKPQKRYGFKDSILYAYEAQKQVVVIGPFLFNGSGRSPTVPELLEHGGTVAGGGRTMWISNGVGRDAKGRFVTGGGMFVKMTGAMNYRARPFMKPALEASIPRFMSRIKDSLR